MQKKSGGKKFKVKTKQALVNTAIETRKQYRNNQSREFNRFPL